MRDEINFAENCREKQSRVLGIAINRGITLGILAAQTGIGEDTLRSYIDRPSRLASIMSWATMIKLLRALPDDLANLLIEDSGYVLKPREAKERNWMGLAAEASGFVAKVCECQRGGFIDHRADMILVEELRSLVADASAELGPGA